MTCEQCIILPAAAQATCSNCRIQKNRMRQAPPLPKELSAPFGNAADEIEIEDEDAAAAADIPDADHFLETSSKKIEWKRLAALHKIRTEHRASASRAASASTTTSCAHSPDAAASASGVKHQSKFPSNNHFASNNAVTNVLCLYSHEFVSMAKHFQKLNYDGQRLPATGDNFLIKNMAARDRLFDYLIIFSHGNDDGFSLLSGTESTVPMVHDSTSTKKHSADSMNAINFGKSIKPCLTKNAEIIILSCDVGKNRRLLEELSKSADCTVTAPEGNCEIIDKKHISIKSINEAKATLPWQRSSKGATSTTLNLPNGYILPDAAPAPPTTKRTSARNARPSDGPASKQPATKQ